MAPPEACPTPRSAVQVIPPQQDNVPTSPGPRLHAAFLPFPRDRLPSELHRLKHEVLIADQVLDGDAQGLRQCNEHTGARHRLVAFVLADRLSRHAAADPSLQSRRDRPAADRDSLSRFADQRQGALRTGSGPTACAPVPGQAIIAGSEVPRYGRGGLPRPSLGAPLGRSRTRGDRCRTTPSRWDARRGSESTDRRAAGGVPEDHRDGARGAARNRRSRPLPRAYR